MAKRPKSTKSNPAGRAGTQHVAEVQYPRRTERRRRTRAKILKVAGDLFGGDGYGPTTMQAISDAADVHVTTLFMHFKSKSELALSLVAESVDELRARAFENQGNVPVFDFVRAEALELGRIMGASKNPGQSLWHALYTDQELAFAWSEFQREQKAIIAGYVAAEYGLDQEKDPRSEIVAVLLLTSAFLPLRRWADGPGKGNIKDEVMKAADIGERAARTILEGPT